MLICANWEHKSTFCYLNAHVGTILANCINAIQKGRGIEESCLFSVNVGEIEKLLIGKEQLNTN